MQRAVIMVVSTTCIFFSSRRPYTRCLSDWSSDVCSSDLQPNVGSIDEELSRRTDTAFRGRRNGNSGQNDHAQRDAIVAKHLGGAERIANATSDWKQKGRLFADQSIRQRDESRENRCFKRLARPP